MMNRDEIIGIRREKDQFFKTSEQSPLSEDQQTLFAGLRYYDPNPALDLVVEVERVTDDAAILFQTTTGELRRYTRFGRFTVTVDEQEVTLTIYETPFGYFLPFADASAPDETYPAGRYLEPERLTANRFHVDFNAAYNPYCAYAVGYSCPLTPPENRIKAAIRAGERNPEGAWVPPE
ncbi:MAG: DUF1684 domain-containing protein [Chloroflexota bacterium]|nr:DUF1684 domain-containing protein [Chloroflexota bacterium]